MGTGLGCNNNIDWSRRRDINRQVEIEKWMTSVMQHVTLEGGGLSPAHNRVVDLINEARNIYSDFVDKVPYNPSTPPTRLADKPVSHIIEEALDGDRGDIQCRIAHTGLGLVELLLKKNKDYGSSVFEPPELDPTASPSVGILARMSDKVRRIRQLRQNGAEVAESIDETVLDLGGYSILWLVNSQLEREKGVTDVPVRTDCQNQCSPTCGPEGGQQAGRPDAPQDPVPGIGQDANGL